jgi:exodeoxyribonuclease-3
VIAPPMKLATFNINGINGRLDLLLRWLKETNPDVVCLQELKVPDAKFPERQLEKAGYGAIWQGQKSWNGVAILARGQEPIETRRGLPGDPDDSHSRYIEAAIDGILVGCLYLPNGNPAPGPKFTYKLEWFDRLHRYAAELLDLGVPVALIGDFNVMPTDLDVYKPERWRDDALFRPRCGKPMRNWSRKAGQTLSGTFTPTSGSIRSGSISEVPSRGTLGCASTTSCSARH